MTVLDHDHFDEAFKSFKRVRAETSDAFLGDEEAIKADFAILRDQILYEKQQEISTWDLFKLPHYRKRLAVGFIMMVGAQATGTQIINSMQILHNFELILLTIQTRLWPNALRESRLQYSPTTHHSSWLDIFFTTRQSSQRADRG
jgi:hypothetical protein